MGFAARDNGDITKSNNEASTAIALIGLFIFVFLCCGHARRTGFGGAIAHATREYVTVFRLVYSVIGFWNGSDPSESI